MSREFNFKRFETGKPLLEQLSAERLNAILDAISRNRPEFGDNVTGQRTPGGTILRTKAGTGGGSGTGDHPFRVFSSFDNTEPPYPVLMLTPGKIGSVTPTIGGVALDDVTPPLAWFYAPGNPFELFLRVKLDSTDPIASLYRTGVTEVLVVSNEDALVIPDIDPDAGEILEWKIFWDDEDQLTGHFYIRVADVQSSTVGGNIVVGQITQWLYTQFRTFLVSGEEAIPII